MDEIQLNKNVGSEWDNRRKAQDDLIYELLKDYIQEFDVDTIIIKFNKEFIPEPEFFISYSRP